MFAIRQLAENMGGGGGGGSTEVKPFPRQRHRWESVWKYNIICEMQMIQNTICEMQMKQNTLCEMQMKLNTVCEMQVIRTDLYKTPRV